MINTYCQLINAILFLKLFQVIINIQRVIASNVNLKTLDNMLGFDVHLQYMIKKSLSFGWTVTQFALRNTIKTVFVYSSRGIRRGNDSTRGTFLLSVPFRSPCLPLPLLVTYIPSEGVVNEDADRIIDIQSASKCGTVRCLWIQLVHKKVKDWRYEWQKFQQKQQRQKYEKQKHKQENDEDGKQENHPS